MNSFFLIFVMIIFLVIPPWRKARGMHRQHQQKAEAVGEVVDLVRLAVLSGTSVHQVPQTVSPYVPTGARETFDDICRRLRNGVSFGEAVDVLENDVPEFHPLVSVLRSAAYDGVPLSQSLDQVAEDVRRQTQRRAEQKARRLPVLLLFPLVFCILPALGFIALVPLALSLFDFVPQ